MNDIKVFAKNEKSLGELSTVSNGFVKKLEEFEIIG